MAKAGRKVWGIPWNRWLKWKQVAWNKGKKWYLSQEAIDKMSKAKIWKSWYMKGKKMTDEQKINMNFEWLKKWPWWNKWQKITEERRIKLSEAKRWEKSRFWKGGISVINEWERRMPEMRLWRRACLERDNYTCQKTGIRGGKLRVHHINSFAEHKDLRLAIDNWITLCEEMHIRFHKLYGKSNNTKEQLNDFLTANI